MSRAILYCQSPLLSHTVSLFLPSRSSEPFRPHRWMTYFVQTSLSLPLALQFYPSASHPSPPCLFPIVSLPSNLVLGFLRTGGLPHPLPRSVTHSPIPTSNPSLDYSHTSRNVRPRLHTSSYITVYTHTHPSPTRLLPPHTCHTFLVWHPSLVDPLVPLLVVSTGCISVA